ncbi:MAG: glycosyltransferase [Muribaculaceae bacterium]|nr:glycosyltransferase [Muribaculaceae bacterium]
MSQSSAHKAPKVSIIVPFLNAEATIARCVRSLMNQTMKDFEVIFVNDGSRDNSFAILNETLLNYPDRIDHTHVLYYTYRQGVAKAHRAGAARATGEYVMRVDADDTLPCDALQLLLSIAVATVAEIVMGRFCRVFAKKTKVGKIDAHYPDINKMALIVDNYSMCNKIVRRSLLTDNNIEVMPEIDCWDDLTLTARAFALSRNSQRIDDVVYNYYITPGAKNVSHSDKDTQLRQHLLAALYLEKWFVTQFPDDRYTPFLNQLKLIAKVKYLRGRNKEVELWKTTFPEVNRRIMSITPVKLHYRLAFWLTAKLPTRITQSIANLLSPRH